MACSARAQCGRYTPRTNAMEKEQATSTMLHESYPSCCRPGASLPIKIGRLPCSRPEWVGHSSQGPRGCTLVMHRWQAGQDNAPTASNAALCTSRTGEGLVLSPSADRSSPSVRPRYGRLSGGSNTVVPMGGIVQKVSRLLLITVATKGRCLSEANVLGG
jgi:hypothetical protein